MIHIQVADLTQAEQGADTLRLLQTYAVHPMGGGKALPEYTQQNLIQTLAQRSDNLVILAYEKEIAVGLCLCFEGFSSFACKPLLNIHDVFVEEDFRGQGVSRLMMEKAEEIARQRGYCKLTLEVLTHNHAAKNSYRKQGYEPYQFDPEFGQAEFWHKNLD